MAQTPSGKYGPYALLILRLVVGLVFVLHGYPKFRNLGALAGFFGGLGIPLPGIMAPWVAVLETFGGLALIAGVLTRYVGVLLAIEMVVTTLIFKLPTLGLIAPTDRPGAGAELDLLLLAGSLTIAALGPGAMSIEERMGKRL